MADDDNDQEKTEEPSGRKLEKAREEGQVSKSQELSSSLLLIAVFASLSFYGSFMIEQGRQLFVEYFMAASQPVLNIDQAVYFSHRAGWIAMIMSAPIILLMLVVSIAVTVLQTGPVFSLSVIAFKGTRINPADGFGRLFSMKGVVELLKGVLKILFITIVLWNTVSGNLDSFLNLCLVPLNHILSETGHWTSLIVGRILVILLLLSIADTIYQRYQYRKELRMTKQEVKDEYKQMEGDPNVKGQRKKIAFRRMKKRLDHAILNADVVVTNPTHYAVALRYDPEKNQAPVVMAKGTRLRALKIREFAQKYDVPIIENPPVARALFASAEEDQFIPPELYQAVAEILAIVFKKRKKTAA